MPKELEKEFWQEVNEYQEEKQMQYITSVERIGIEKGLQQGLQQGSDGAFSRGPAAVAATAATQV